jgi:hypothetical protein
MLQRGLINSCIAPRDLMVNCQNIFFNANTYFFLVSNSDRDFYSGNKNVLQVYTYITKIQKKVKKRHYRLFSLHFALNIGAIFAQSLCYYLSFVFPANLIWLLIILYY